MTANRHGFGILAAVLLLSSCHMRRHGEDVRTCTVQDMLGREVVLPGKIERIAGLRPGALRLLAYMGVTDRVVGIEQVEKGGDDRPYMRAYPELLKLPLIGPRGGDAELIVNTHPDVIFMTYASAADADAMQSKTGIPVVALLYPEMGTDIEQLYASLALIGKILRREARADSLTAYIRRTISELHERTACIDAAGKPSAYIGGIAHGRARSITSTHPDYPPFIFVNAENVAGRMDRRHTSSLAGAYVDTEQLLLWNPDVIFVDESGLALAAEDLKPGGLLSGLAAVQTNRVYALPAYNSYAANFEIALVDSWFIGKILYPEAFADVTAEEKADEIMKTFLGKSVFREMLSPHSFQPVTPPHPE
ncbi:MAG: iron ABC transporter substrate-binding protein [Tannerella sp.]|nr:iron ABC transporter substrate-binding protein [Tannerella sp.]